MHCGGRVVDPLRIFKNEDPKCVCPYCGERYSVATQKILEEIPDNPLAFFANNRKTK
ncbi:unnamed protein product, partial [marine sediment metagenome]